MNKLTKMLTMTAAAAVLFATTATSFAAGDNDVVAFPVEKQEVLAFSVEIDGPGFGFEIGDDNDWEGEWDHDDDWDDDDGWDDDDWDDYGDWDDDDEYDPWG